MRKALRISKLVPPIPVIFPFVRMLAWRFGGQRLGSRRPAYSRRNSHALM
jgi:hypothetical protein